MPPMPPAASAPTYRFRVLRPRTPSALFGPSSRPFVELAGPAARGKVSGRARHWGAITTWVASAPGHVSGPRCTGAPRAPSALETRVWGPKRAPNGRECGRLAAIRPPLLSQRHGSAPRRAGAHAHDTYTTPPRHAGVTFLGMPDGVGQGEARARGVSESEARVQELVRPRGRRAGDG
eukprot:scaffold1808_cov360-Prasinococcus_capsulatus_cf.AAC.7